MTDKIYLEDCYAREAQARVVEVRPEGVVLDRTILYARSGGQPGDAGALRWDGGEAAVAEALKFEGDGVLLLRLGGTCHGCAASTVTLRQGIEARLREMVPEVKHVEAV